MKKIALISTFCDNEEKTKLLINNVKKIKSFDVDVMIISPLKVPDELIDICDYVIITKENPVLDWPEKSYYQWWDGTIGGKHITMETTYPDYGYAGLVQIKRMSDLSLSMDYDLFFPMIYDINITQHVEEVFRGNLKNSFFPSMRDGHIWGIGLHLISLDKEHLIRFKTMITKESYLVEGEFDAFAWLHRAVKLVPGVVEKTPVEDLIYFLENKNFFDFSLCNKYKCFIHKSGYDNVKLVFYDYGGIKNFIVRYNNNSETFDLREWEQVEIPTIDLDTLEIEHDGEVIDYTQTFKKIGQNILKIR